METPKARRNRRFWTGRTSEGVSYLGWAWFVGSCADEPSLIKDYSGQPTPYGSGYRAHLLPLVKPA